MGAIVMFFLVLTLCGIKEDFFSSIGLNSCGTVVGEAGLVQQSGADQNDIKEIPKLASVEEVDRVQQQASWAEFIVQYSPFQELSSVHTSLALSCDLFSPIFSPFFA